ncbi:MAG: AMP-binding protein [Streptosporangiales bacterium]|nr:AMP-binding protein [Streptosporangiales bacterium]
MALTLLHDLLDRRARRSPHRACLVRGTAVWTYTELRRLSLAYAGWLHGRGVRRGDRVLILAPHAPATLAMVYATSRLGAVHVVVGDRLRPYTLRHIVADCTPCVAVVEGAGPWGGTSDLFGVPAHAFEEIPHEPRGRPPCTPGPLSVDPAGLIYTSGSTAMPKAVVSGHRQVLFAAQAIQSQLRYRPDDVVFCCLPLSFDYGMYQAYLCALAGATLVLGDAVDAGPPLLGRLREHEVTVLPLVPSLAKALCLLVERSGVPPARLRMVTNTGAALPERLAARMLSLIPALGVFPMFGLTECKRVSILKPGERPGHPGSVGRPLPDTEAYVIGEDGGRLPPGEVGELVVRGPHVMAGYWRAPELTAARFRRAPDGGIELHTGDMCHLDADGYLYFHGRRDELYKQGGYRISAAEVEGAAMDVPGVELAALLPPEGERGAVLAVTGALSPYELRDRLAERLEPARLPAEFHVLAALPLHPNGKIDKSALPTALSGELRGVP